MTWRKAPSSPGATRRARRLRLGQRVTDDHPGRRKRHPGQVAAKPSLHGPCPPAARRCSGQILDHQPHRPVPQPERPADWRGGSRLASIAWPRASAAQAAVNAPGSPSIRSGSITAKDGRQCRAEDRDLQRRARVNRRPAHPIRQYRSPRSPCRKWSESPPTAAPRETGCGSGETSNKPRLPGVTVSRGPHGRSHCLGGIHNTAPAEADDQLLRPHCRAASAPCMTVLVSGSGATSKNVATRMPAFANDSAVRWYASSKPARSR